MTISNRGQHGGPRGDITEMTFLAMARQAQSKAHYELAIAMTGFAPAIYGKVAERCWRKARDNKEE